MAVHIVQAVEVHIIIRCHYNGAIDRGESTEKFSRGHIICLSRIQQKAEDNWLIPNPFIDHCRKVFFNGKDYFFIKYKMR